VTLVNGRELDVFRITRGTRRQHAPGLPVTLATRSPIGGRATLTGVVPSANAASRRQMVRVRLENPQELLPGMAIQNSTTNQFSSFGTARCADSARRTVADSVVEGKAKQFEVELIADMGEKMAISNEQLKVGQPVVVR